MPRKLRGEGPDDIIDERTPSAKTRKRPPAKTVGERENQLVNMALDLLEERFRNKTATAQEILLFAKIGTTPEKLDKELKEKQKALFDAKTESLKQSKVNQELMAKAMEQFKVYSGQAPDETYDEED